MKKTERYKDRKRDRERGMYTYQNKKLTTKINKNKKKILKA